MNKISMAALSAMLLAGAAVLAVQPARADSGVGFSFGYDGDGSFNDPCDYYDYYDEAPPWGLPPDYCDYPVYSEPVYFGGYWYRGPIYYRWYHGRRLFWLHGGWHEDGWRGARPPRISWQNRGGWNNGFRPGVGYRGGRDWRGGVGGHPWPGTGGNRPWQGHGNNPWPGNGGNHPWQGGGGHPWPGNGGSHPWQGGHGGYGSGPGGGEGHGGGFGGGAHGGGFGGGHQGDGGGSHGGFGGGHGPH